jgi:hypothetical protein
MKSNRQAIMPEEFLKKVLPKIPSSMNPARGRRGINAV